MCLIDEVLRWGGRRVLDTLVQEMSLTEMVIARPKVIPNQRRDGNIGLIHIQMVEG